MWHKSLQNLYKIIGLCAVFTLKAAGPTYAQDIGLVEGLEKLISFDREKLQNKAKIIASNPLLASDMKNKQIFIDEDFLLSIFFNSDPNYLRLISENLCSFYNLLNANVLKTAEGPITNMMVRVVDTEGNNQSAITPLADYLSRNAKGRCNSINQVKKAFSRKKIKKTFAAQDFKIPTDLKSCHDNFNYWISNQYTAHYCNIAKSIGAIQTARRKLEKGNLTIRSKQKLRAEVLQGEKYRKIVDNDRYYYLNHLCSNLRDEKSYCEKYTTLSYWNKILQTKSHLEYIAYRCQGILQSKKIPNTRGKLEECIGMINRNKYLCTFSNNQRYPSLSPRPNCDDISTALNSATLFSDYKDCPGNISNEGVINISRLIMHRERKALTPSLTACNTNPSAMFAKLNLDADNDKAWGLQLCYDDKINEKEICLPTIMGEHPDSPYSESKVLHDILVKTRGVSKTSKCIILEKKEYRPHLLKYKNGCFAIYDETNCTAITCPKTLMLNEKKITHIRYTGDVRFDYFPSSFRNEKYSVVKILTDKRKLKSSRISNYSSVKFFFKERENTILHGIACIEDLLPYHFKKRYFNQCRPVAFIVDGMIPEIDGSDNKELVIRTAIDDIHSPRIIRWPQLFSALKNYQQFHPLKIWTLYAIN